METDGNSQMQVYPFTKLRRPDAPTPLLRPARQDLRFMPLHGLDKRFGLDKLVVIFNDQRCQ